LGEFDAVAVTAIIVDNDPLEQNARLCRQLAPQLPIALNYVEEPRSGVTHARNTAIEQALAQGADFVALIDDDDIPQADWLLKLLERQAETGADLVFGTWQTDPDMPGWALKSGIFRDPDKAKNIASSRRYGLPAYASTCNVMAGRDILVRLSELGPVFNHNFMYSGGEDKDMFIRARSLGAKLESADASIIHLCHQPERYAPRELLRRGFKCGCSQVGMARAHGNLERTLQLRIKALLKLPLVVLTLPLAIFSKAMFLAHLCRIGKSSGVLYAAFTGRAINCYARGEDA
ncbi:MAG: glycosyltransferase family 2 protein, partial [Lysobacterales bacterium]